MSKTAYKYDETTKEYLHETMAQEDPKNPGTWLLPANATFTAPPEAQEGYVRVWGATAWSQVEDHRGATIWKDWQTSKEMKELGPVPEGWSLVKPEKPVDVGDYDAALEAHLNKERSDRGYTTREPDTYINSSVARWKQDALDWVAHKDAVMLYGLEIENKFIAGEPVPTLAEFKEALPKIQWSIALE